MNIHQYFNFTKLVDNFLIKWKNVFNNYDCLN